MIYSVTYIFFQSRYWPPPLKHRKQDCYTVILISRQCLSNNLPKYYLLIRILSSSPCSAVSKQRQGSGGELGASLDSDSGKASERERVH